MKEARHKSHIQYDSIYMKYPEWVNQHRNRKQSGACRGWRKDGMESDTDRSFYGGYRNILGLDQGGGLHITVNILHATELYSLKRLIYVMQITPQF